MGVSQKTVYKWIARYKQEGMEGLHNRSSKPLHSLNKLTVTHLELIQLLYCKACLSARAIADHLKLACSTVTKALRAMKLTKKTAVRPPANRYEYDAPGEIIHMDIKKLARFNTPGHRVGEKPKANKNCGYEYVHVCIDDHSRWGYVSA